MREPNIYSVSIPSVELLWSAKTQDLLGLLITYTLGFILGRVAGVETKLSKNSHNLQLQIHRNHLVIFSTDKTAAYHNLNY